MIVNELLEKEKMSRYRLSRESGVPMTTITDICSGKAELDKCAAGTLYKIAKVFGVTVDALLENNKVKTVDLYDSYDSLPENSRLFIESIYEKDSLEGLYKLCRQHEQENRDVLLAFQDDYPGILNGNNLEEVLKTAKEKKGSLIFRNKCFRITTDERAWNPVVRRRFENERHIGTVLYIRKDRLIHIRRRVRHDLRH